MPITAELEENLYSDIYKFALNFYGKLCTNEGSFVVAPFSTYTCLALIYCGASGNTAKQLHKALPLPTDNRKDVCEISRRIIESQRRYSFFHSVSNMFCSRDVNVRTEFTDFATNSFRMRPESISFTNITTAGRILNDYVMSNTSGKIEQVCNKTEITPDMRIVFVTAFTLKAKWRHVFMKSDTIRDKFCKTATEQKDMEFMVQTQVFNYIYSPQLDAEMIELPYREGDFSVVMILPKEHNNLRSVEEKLDTNEIFSALEGMVPVLMTVKIPILSIATGGDLQEKLTRLGIGKIFSSDAELGKLCNESRERINAYFAKTTFCMNEEGSVEPSDERPSQDSVRKYSTLPQPFEADHPFMFFVKSRRSIFLIGRYLG